MKSHAYPLTWPPGWPRTVAERRENSRFKVTVSSALDFMQDEVRRLGAKNLVISSNYTLGTTSPKDPGVCAYFEYQDIRAAIPCDRWKRIEDNVHAIAKTIEAMRGIERWGAKHMIKAAFTGFAALPAPSKEARNWQHILELGTSSETTLATAEASYKRLRSKYHPDRGGDATMFDAVEKAWELAKQELGG